MTIVFNTRAALLPLPALAGRGRKSASAALVVASALLASSSAAFTQGPQGSSKAMAAQAKASPPAPADSGTPNALQGFSQNRGQPIHIDAAKLEVRDKDKVA